MVTFSEFEKVKIKLGKVPVQLETNISIVQSVWNKGK